MKTCNLSWSLLRRSRYAALATLAVGVSGLCAYATPITYNLTIIPGAGGSDLQPAAINDAGVVVGSEDSGLVDSDGNSIVHAFVYNSANQTTIDIGAGNPQANSQATGINNAGTIVGYSDAALPEQGFTATHAFATTSVITSSSDLGTRQDNTDSYATAINTSGTIAGFANGEDSDGNFSILGFTTTSTVPNAAFVSPLSPGKGSQLAALNDGGTGVGLAPTGGKDSDNNEIIHAISFSNGVTTDLGALGSGDSEATGINNAGTVIGYSTLDGSDGNFHAFAANGTITAASDLGTFGGADSAASGINNAGTIVGFSQDANGTYRAFVDFNGVMTDLNTLLAPGADPDGLILSGATGINNKGQIVGEILTDDGGSEAFLLTPNYPAVYWSGANSTLWSNAGNWAADANSTTGGSVPDATTDVVFSTTTPQPQNLGTMLDAPQAIHSLTITSSSPDMSIGNGNITANTLTIGDGGITALNTQDTDAISTGVILSAGQTWNVGANVFLIINGVISDGGSNATLTKTGDGYVILYAAPTYTGGTQILGGTLEIRNFSATGNFTTQGANAQGSSGGIFSIASSASGGNATITNNGGTVDGAGGGATVFAASAGTANIVNNPTLAANATPGATYFQENGTAASAIILNNAGGAAGALGGLTKFSNRTDAGMANITNESSWVANAPGGLAQFFDTSSAANATISNVGATITGGLAGSTEFHNSSNAGSAQFHNSGGFDAQAPGGSVQFFDTSSGGTGNFTNQAPGTEGAFGGSITFHNSSGAGAANYVNEGSALNASPGGTIFFLDTSVAGSVPGLTATFTNYGGTDTGALGGVTTFSNSSSAGTATFSNNAGTAPSTGPGMTIFQDNSNAGAGLPVPANFYNNGSNLSNISGGFTQFSNSSSAGDAILNNNPATFGGGNPGATTFFNFASAANATINNIGADLDGAAGGDTELSGNSTLGSATVINTGGSANGALGGTIEFLGESTAGNANITISAAQGPGASGAAAFFKDSNSKAATIVVNGGAAGAGAETLAFSNSATASTGTTITVNAATELNGFGASVTFHDSSVAGTGGGAGTNFTIAGSSVSSSGSAGSVTFADSTISGYSIFNISGGTGSFGQGGSVSFHDSASASLSAGTANGGTAPDAGGGSINFYDSSTAASSNLTANAGSAGASGGRLYFVDSSTGGDASIHIFGNGTLHIADHAAPGLSIGSLDGSGLVLLGNNNLTVGANNADTLFSGSITDTGAGSLTKTGAGTLTLTGNNTFLGNTTILAGTLFLTDGGQLASHITLNGGKFSLGAGTSINVSQLDIPISGVSAIGGNGTFTGNLNFSSPSTTVAPGNSPGDLHFAGDQTWSAFTYQWQVNDFTANNPGTASDLVEINGALILTDHPGSYGLDVASLMADNTVGNVPHFSETPETWTILTTTTGITNFNPADWTLDTSGFANPFLGSFSLLQNGGALDLVYTPGAVPEPTTLALLAPTTALLLKRRRRQL